ncbi:MAG TPA: CHAT domain-containing protein [Cyclobacteriaceae bacterium]|nr:CHAT domain-containing protein [Cyclobacteriaceae bacterium]
MLALNLLHGRSFCVVIFIFLSLTSYSQRNNVPLWKIYYDSGNIYLKNDAPRAVQLFAKAETVARNDLGIYDDNYLVILGALGISNENARNFPQAKKYLTQTVDLGHEVYKEGDPRMLQSLYNLGVFLRKTNNIGEASELFQRILSSSEKIKDRNFYALSATQLVNIEESKHHLDSALSLAQKTISSSLLNQYESITYDLQLAEGRILRKLKMYERSQTTLNSLHKQLIARGSAFRPQTRAVALQLSLLDIDLGRYSKAEKDLLQQYRLAKTESSNDNPGVTEITNSLAFVYEKLGVYDKAIAYYNEALGYCTTTTANATSCDAIENNIAGIYLKLRQYDKALEKYQSYINSRNDSERLTDPDFLAALNNLATALRQNGQPEKALPYLNQVYQSLNEQTRGEDDLASTVLNNIGVAQILTGNYTEATTNFKKALSIKESFYGTDSPILLDLCSNLAVSLWVDGKRTEALPYFKRSLDLGLREVKYNFQNLTEAEQLQFYAQQKENFERFNTLAVQAGPERPDMLIQMFNNQVFLKSLVFFTNRRATAAVKEINDPGLRSALELKQSKSVQLSNHYQSTLEQLRSNGISLSKLEKEIDSLDKIIRHKLPNIADENNYATWNDIQKVIHSDEVSVDIIRFRKYDALPRGNSGIKIGFTDSIYYAALITSSKTTESPGLVLLKNGRDLEKRLFAYYKNSTKFDLQDSISYPNYWAPIEKAIAGKKKIHYTPDGIYRQVNINTIQDRQGVYNIEKYEIQSSLNPASILDNSPAKQVDLSKLVLMGNAIFGLEQSIVGANYVQSSFEPLPGTEEELAEISKLVKGKLPTQYVRAQASEQNLRKIKSPGTLHIATHGYFASDYSYLNEQVKSEHLFQSGLLLSAGKAQTNPTDNDGIVTAYDIINLDLSKTDLVVLSACETGVGKNEYGEGIHGLQRSFMLAGAKDVVISLWRVDDRVTKDLMIKFYQNLLQKRSPTEALRLSQLEIMKREPARRLWGSFITISSN